MDFQTIFNQNLSQYISKLTTSGDVYDFSNMALITLSVLAIATELFRFTTDKFDPPTHFLAVLCVMATMMLQKGFIPAMDLIWQTGDALGMAFMEAATGNRDPLYLAKWLTSTFGKMDFTGVSFVRDGISTIFMVVFLYLVSLLLSTIMFLVGLWAVWGLALSKLLALIFIPTFAYKPFRSFFMTWLQFFLGFVFLMVILRITGSLAALALQSEFINMGASNCSSHGLCEVQAKYLSNPKNQGSLLFTSILSLLMIGSSFKFAHAFANATSAMSNSAARGLKSGAKTITDKLTSNGSNGSRDNSLNMDVPDIPTPSVHQPAYNPSQLK